MGLIADHLNFDQLAEMMLSKFLHWKVINFPPYHFLTMEENHYVQPNLRSGIINSYAHE